MAIAPAPAATTPEMLMVNFSGSYEEMLIDPFTDLLHPDFQMILLSGTLEDWGWADGFYFNFTDMVTIHTHIFSEEPGMDVDWNLIHPIGSIVIDLLEPQGAWNPIPEEDLRFGGYEGMWANYEVGIKFWDAYLSHNFWVQQSVNFYVAPVTENDSTEYRLLGIRGLPPLGKSDEISWDSFLALYR